MEVLCCKNAVRLCSLKKSVLDLICRKDFEMVQIGAKIEEEQALVIQLQKKIKELQVKSLSNITCLHNELLI